MYVENLTPVACSSYKEIETRMDEGTAARTVASTKMNATSSRAHTVFGINFTTISEVDGAVSEMTARMNLVDLAGSERAESTGATGDRLKEGVSQQQRTQVANHAPSTARLLSLCICLFFSPSSPSALSTPRFQR